jgi:cytochrome c nitrite reductase small subunit
MPDDPSQTTAKGWTAGRIWLGAGGLYLLVAVLAGVLSGLGVFTFGYGEGASYLSNNPNACANCHVMQDHYDSWLKSSHHAVATCNDCHLSPHPVGKWVTKADNGFFHSLAFTTGQYPDPIRIKPRNRAVTQTACLKCHGEFVDAMKPAHAGGDMLNCIHCHTAVGHAGRGQ